MKYIFLLLIFITHLGSAMSLKSLRKELLTDATSVAALDKMVATKQSEYGDAITRESIVDKVLLPIAAVETGNRYDPTIVQYVENKETGEVTPTGKGKGLFQFEPESMKTALVRASKHTQDKFVKKHLQNKDFDATKLTPGEQAAMLVYDLMEKKGADVGLVVSDQAPISTFWENFHWAGHKKSSTLGVMKKRINFQIKNFKYNQELEDIKKEKK